MPSSRDISLQSYLRHQYWIFTLILVSTFLIASTVMSVRATLVQHKGECLKFSERLIDLREIFVREAVLQSSGTVNFELERLGAEFGLSKIRFNAGVEAGPDAVCSVSFRGYSTNMHLRFGQTDLGTISAEKSIHLFSKTDFVGIIFPISLSFLIVLILFYWLRRRFEIVIVRPLISLSAEIKGAAVTGEVKVISEITEYVSLRESTNQLVMQIRDSAERIRVLEISEEIAKLSTQVAHDIRSPLSALSMMEGQIGALSEEHRTLIKTAIRRINDIANDLLKKGRDRGQTARVVMEPNDGMALPARSYLVSALVDSLVSEKRIEYRSKVNLGIEVDLASSYGLFISMQPLNLQRLLSNLINNAIEALPNVVGLVRIRVSSEGENVIILVSDNGAGIPKSIVDKIGKSQFSYGKEGTSSGSGLGVQHAISSLEEVGGKLTIHSRAQDEFGIENSGTDVTISLPIAATPQWFVKNVEIKNGSQLIIVDDDQSIHEIWKSKFNSNFVESRISLLHFSDIGEFIAWAVSKPLSKTDLILIDFEFIGQALNGLDALEKLKLQSQAILVTGRFDDNQIQSRCVANRIRLISKSQAGLVPIRILM